MINKISLKRPMSILLSVVMLLPSVGASANTFPVWRYNTEPDIKTLSVVQNLTLPKSVEVADINADGRLDIITASNSYSNPSLYWHDNSDPWSQNIIADRKRMDIFTVGDMDGDGDIDVIAGSSTYDDIYWYENGNEWAETLVFEGTYTINFINVADIDGDGDLDIITGSSNNDIITWYENGNSWSELTITSNVDSPRDVQTADMDGDGDLDVVSASYTDDKVAWFENGNNWTEVVITEDADGAQDIEIGDIDGDGDLDVLVSSYNDMTVAWFENGNVWNKTIIIDRVSRYSNQWIDIADMDGDGDLDLLIGSEYFNNVAWYENGNDWSQNTIVSEETRSLKDILARDMDGDGDQDILLLTSNDVTLFQLEGYDRTIPLYWELLEGTELALPIEAYDEDTDVITYSLTGDDSTLFKVSSTGVVSFISPPEYYLFADHNNDNVFELTLTASDGKSSISKNINIKVLLGLDSDNDGVTDAKELLDGTDPYDYHSKLDTDGDGVPDRLEPYFGGDINTPDAIDSDGDGVSDYIELFYGENDAPTWIAEVANGQHWKLANIGESYRTDVSIAIMDITEDGIKDIVSSSRYRLEVLDGANNFSPTTLHESEDNTYFTSVKILDLTNDGKDNPDIIVSGIGEGVYWYEHGTWIKRPITDYSIGGQINAYDMDSDGDLDIVGRDDNQIVWYENGNVWSRHVLVDYENYLSNLELIDYDFDGDIDIVATFQNIDRISWFENKETWEEHIITSNINSPNNVIIKDIDDDGLFDILVASATGQFTLLKQGNGWQESKLDFLSNCKTHLDLTISDMNNDGVLDIACVEYSDMAWFNAADNWSKVEIQTDPLYIDNILFDDIDNDSDVDVISINSNYASSSSDYIYVNFNTNEVSKYSVEVPDLSSELRLPFIAFDLDGQDLTYSLSEYDAKYFSVDDDGILTFASKISVGSPVDFDGNNIYDFELTANDGVYSSSVNLALTIIESVDTDNDGILDSYDIDDDNDLVPDTVEIKEGTDPLDANSFLDEDKNGVPDFVQKSEALFINYQFPLGISLNEGSFTTVNLSSVTSENGIVSIELSGGEGLNYKFRDNVLYIYADYVTLDQTVNINITLSDGVEIIEHIFPVFVKNVLTNRLKVELVREAKAMSNGLRLKVIGNHINTSLDYKWYINDNFLTSIQGNVLLIQENDFLTEDIVIKVEVSDDDFTTSYLDGMELNRTSFLAEIAQSQTQIQGSKPKPSSDNVAGSTNLISLLFTIYLLFWRKQELKVRHKGRLLLVSLLVFSITACSSSSDTKDTLSSELANATQTVRISLDKNDPLYLAKQEYEAEKERKKLENIRREIEREERKKNERTHISTIGF